MDSSDLNIWVAASDGDLEAVKSLIQDGMDVDATDEYGYTPLLASISYNHKSLVVYLLSNGANINIQDSLGNGVMHYCENVDMASFLLDHGADPLLKNEDDELPIQSHFEDENMEMVEFLKQFTPDLDLENFRDMQELDDPQLNDMIQDLFDNIGK